MTIASCNSNCPEKFREIYNFAFGWAKEKVLFSLSKGLDFYTFSMMIISTAKMRTF